MCLIPANPDIAGIGVRIAIYAQNLLCFFPAFWALLDGKVTETELESAETQATTNLVLAFAILISSMVQTTTLGLTSYHASIVLSMSWMNNTNAFIYFLLYVQHKSQPTPGSGHVVEPTFRAWARHIRCSFLPGTNTGQVNHTSSAESGRSGGPSVQTVGNDTGMPTLPSSSAKPEELGGAGAPSNVEVGIERDQGETVDARTAAKNLVKRYVLPLGSLHLSLMAALGLWLWIDIHGFGNMRDTANNCAAEHALISILGSHIPFASRALRIVSFVIYSLFLVPGLNLLLPIVVFLGFHYCARGLPPTLIKPGQDPRIIRRMSFWERLGQQFCDPPLRWAQKSIARWWSVFPPVLGLVFLLAINLVFIIDIELTLKQNAHLQDPDEGKWGFGQILAILLLFMPLRDLAEALLAHKMQKEMNMGLEGAVNQKQWDAVLAFVARGADPNIDMRGETTAIRVAYLSNRVDVVKALLDAGSDPNIESGRKRDTEIIQRENKACLQLLRNYDIRLLDSPSALKEMMNKRYYAGVMLLLTAPGIDINAPDAQGLTPLHFAAENGYEAVVKLLLAAPGIDVNTQDTNGRTPLSVAAGRSHEAVVKLLLAAPGIDGNAPSTAGRTPLSFAASQGHEAVVKLLLAAPGINVNAPTTTGWTPLTWAAYKGEEAVAKLLLAAPGINVNAADNSGMTLLIFAAKNGHEAIVKLLLAAPGIDVNAPDTYGRTPLSFAAEDGREAAVELLLATPGINVNAPETDGWTPLMYAAFHGHEAVVNLLLAAPGIDINTPDTAGWTPLTLAAWWGHKAAVKLLLAAPGINVNAADTSGWTALIWAAFMGEEAVVQDLCSVPGIIVDVADVKRQLESPPKGWHWRDPASKAKQEKCVRILEEFVESNGGGAQDGSEGPSGG